MDHRTRGSSSERALRRGRDAEPRRDSSLVLSPSGATARRVGERAFASIDTLARPLNPARTGGPAARASQQSRPDARDVQIRTRTTAHKWGRGQPGTHPWAEISVKTVAWEHESAIRCACVHGVQGRDMRIVRMQLQVTPRALHDRGRTPPDALGSSPRGAPGARAVSGEAHLRRPTATRFVRCGRAHLESTGRTNLGSSRRNSCSRRCPAPIPARTSPASLRSSVQLPSGWPGTPLRRVVRQQQKGRGCPAASNPNAPGTEIPSTLVHTRTLSRILFGRDKS
jgi:hypothetical protein